jgi:membrane-associated phospholipid phosphatase
MRSNVVVLAIGQLILIPHTVSAQKDSVSHPGRERVPASAWIVPAGIAASAVFDPELREWTLHRHTRSLDRFAKSVNPLGAAQQLVPTMVVTYVIASVTHHESFASAILNTGAAYLAVDLVESSLKPVVGRERPHVEGNSHHFDPFTTNGDWHSFPSAHVAHITSIAQAISMQMHSGPLTALCGSLVALVAWDRVYEDQHWTSDVAATIALSSQVSGATVRWLQSHWPHALDGERNSRLQTAPGPQHYDRAISIYMVADSSGH